MDTEDISQLRDRLDAMNRRLDDLSRTNKAAGAEETKEMKRQIDEASRRLKEKWNQLSDKAQEAGQSVHGYVKDNPWQSVAIAAATGFVAASVLSLLGAKRKE